MANTNSFEFEVVDNVRMCALFDVISMFNHSCSPNVLTFIRGPRMSCIASRNIEANEELFIDYCSFFRQINRAKRQLKLRFNWQFDCTCVRCMSNQEITSQQIEDAVQMGLASVKRELRNSTNQWTTEMGALIIAYDHLLRRALF